MGVTVYLTQPATSEVLDVIAQSGDGTTLVADFVLHVEERDELGAAAASAAASLIASIGEPVAATFRRGEVEALVRDAGFSRVELLDARELSHRYLRHLEHRTFPGSTVIAVAAI
jgi:O-methyltransferase involved in polyketide biosynthesis